MTCRKPLTSLGITFFVWRFDMNIILQALLLGFGLGAIVIVAYLIDEARYQLAIRKLDDNF